MWVVKCNIYFSLATQEINSCWSDQCPAWFSLGPECSSAQHICQNNSSKAVWGKKGTPHPPQNGDISIKDEERLLKWHKAILSRKSETKSNSFHQPAHKGNESAYSPTASWDWRDVFVSGGRSPRESFQLPEETLMKEFWVMEEPWCFHCCSVCCCWERPLYVHYRVQQSRVMTLGLQFQTSPKLFLPSRPLSEKKVNFKVTVILMHLHSSAVVNRYCGEMAFICLKSKSDGPDAY